MYLPIVELSVVADVFGMHTWTIGPSLKRIDKDQYLASWAQIDRLMTDDPFELLYLTIVVSKEGSVEKWEYTIRKKKKEESNEQSIYEILKIFTILQNKL